ncbi:hypothetical protein QO198_09170 [Pseudoalteromonas distincta]|uniref:hypothetical protein n=1 Tax=Pseudoalteromonas distincta TaxID=77608 RepID=UPI00352FEAEB
MDDKEIIDLMRNGRYSSLEFLEDDKLLSVNKNYLGYLYFILDLKSYPTAEVLNKISENKGGLDNAYEYLGQIAKSLFYYFNESYIAESFYKLSIAENDKNANAWWGLFRSSRNEVAFLNSISIYYEIGDFSVLNSRLLEIFNSEFDFKESEWNSLIEILNDKRIVKNRQVKKILFTAYSKVERHSEGVKFIDDIYYADAGVLKSYISSQTLSYESALSKVLEYSLEEFLNYDYVLVFEEYIRRKDLGVLNVNKTTVIESAFRGEMYSTVIKVFNENWKAPLENDLNCKIYYLISQLFTGSSFDKSIYDEVIQSPNDSAIKKALEVKLLIKQLYYFYEKDDDLKFPIANWELFTRADNILEDSEFINHYLYDELHRDLASLEKLFDQKYYRGQFDKDKLSSDILDISYNDFIKVCNHCLDEKLYEKGISNVNRYHESNKPNIQTYNILGVLYERVGRIDKACETYYLALNNMEKCKVNRPEFIGDQFV